MVTARDPIREKLTPEIGDTERLIEEFRQKVSQTLEWEKTKLREIAEKDAKAILAKAYQESASITSKANEEAQQILENAREKADRERDIILAQARERAEQIVASAEEATKREAKEKTRKEVELILRLAKEEATRTTTKALQTAKEEADALIAQAKKEAELVAQKTLGEAETEAKRITREAFDLKQKAEGELLEAQKKAGEEAALIISAAREKARQVAEMESSNILAQARESAHREREQMLAAALEEVRRTAETEKEQLMQKARAEAEAIINSARNQIRAQFEASNRLMMEIQQQMQKAMDIAGVNLQKTGPRTEISSASGQTPAPALRPVLPEHNPGDNGNGKTNVSNRQNTVDLYQAYVDDFKNETNLPSNATPVKEAPQDNAPDSRLKPITLAYDEKSRTYQGRLKVDIAPPVDHDQISFLESGLQGTTGLQIINKGIAEDGSAWLEIEATSPLPLLDILHKIPSVKDVVGAKSYIIIALKAKQQ